MYVTVLSKKRNISEEINSSKYCDAYTEYINMYFIINSAGEMGNVASRIDHSAQFTVNMDSEKGQKIRTV